MPISDTGSPGGVGGSALGSRARRYASRSLCDRCGSSASPRDLGARRDTRSSSCSPRESRGHRGRVAQDAIAGAGVGWEHEQVLRGSDWRLAEAVFRANIRCPSACWKDSTRAAVDRALACFTTRGRDGGALPPSTMNARGRVDAAAIREGCGSFAARSTGAIPIT
jgi:hypothetical protein